MKVADITSDGQKIGWIDLAMLEDDDRFPRTVHPDIGSDAPLIGTPDRGRGASGPYRNEPESPRQRQHRERRERHEDKPPTFRPGLTPRGKAPPAKPEHFTVDDVQKRLRGEQAPERDTTGKPKAVGSEYLRQERKWIKDELDADPQLRRKLRGVLVHEQRGGERSKVAESLFNRLNLERQRNPSLTLKEYLNRRGSHQFYGPLRRGEISEAYLSNVDRFGRDVDAEIDTALGGSNAVKGFTDQGSAGDPNFARERASGEYVYSNGELYGDMPGGKARQYRLEQQARVRAGGATHPDQPEVPRGVTRLPAEPQPEEDLRTAGPRTEAAPTAPGEGAMRAATGEPPEAFIIHHTGGRGTIESLQQTLRGRGLGVEYAMDREGNIRQIGGPGAANIMPESRYRRTPITGRSFLTNKNIVGMEIIAKDDKDVTPKQVEAAKEFIRRNYPNTPVFGHGEVNPGHKEADEGRAAVTAIRIQRESEAAEARQNETKTKEAKGPHVIIGTPDIKGNE